MFMKERDFMEADEWNDIYFDLATAAFERGLYGAYLEVWRGKQKKSPYIGTELEHFSLLNGTYVGRIFELAAIDLLELCGFDVQDVATDNDEAGVDLLVNGYAVDVKGARQAHLNDGRTSKRYILAHINPEKADIVLGFGLCPNHLVGVAMDVNTAGLRLDVGGQAKIALSTVVSNKWSKYGGSMYQTVAKLATLVGASIGDGAHGVDLDQYYIDRVAHHAAKFEAPTQELDGLHSLLQLLSGSHVGATFEEELLKVLRGFGYNTRAAVGEEQGLYGDILVTTSGGAVWLELKLSASNDRVAFYNIGGDAEFSYLVGLHVDKGVRRLYIIPKEVTLDTDITGVMAYSHNKDNTIIMIHGNSPDNPTHPLYKYQYTLHAGLAKLDRILKGNI